MRLLGNVRAAKDLNTFRKKVNITDSSRCTVNFVNC